MPHTNSRTSTATKRKQAKPVHTKRVILEDDEGWAHVVGGKTRKHTTNELLKTEKGDFAVGKFQYMNKTLEELQKEYESAKRSWEKSSACGELKKLLKGEDMEERMGKVDNVVVFGLGTFQAVEVQHSRTSMTQLAALDTILSCLGSSTPLPVAQQDPAFTSLDREFLSSFNHTVVDDPEGYKKVTENSLVYAIHCYPDVYDGVRKAATPAVLIGNDLKGEEPTAFNNLEEFKDLQKLYEGLERVAVMPMFGNSFSSTVVFTRKEKDGKVDEATDEVSAAAGTDEVAELVDRLQI